MDELIENKEIPKDVTFELVAEDGNKAVDPAARVVFWNELEPDCRDDEEVEGYEPIPVDDDKIP